MKKEIIFSCGDNLMAKADYGHAYGRLIGHESVDGNGKSQFAEGCKDCTKCEKITRTTKYMDTETYEETRYKDTICIGYSQEYLDNKDKPTANWVDMDGAPHGSYTIEVILQSESYRRVEYFKGTNENCSVLSLMEVGLDNLLEKSYSEEDKLYHLIMFNTETGQLQDIDFENEDDVKDLIISMRLLQEDEE